MGVLWLAPKAAATIIIFLFFQLLPVSVRKVQQLRLYSLLFIVLFVRDVAFAIFPNSNIPYITDLLIPIYYLFWLRTYTGPRKRDTWIYIAIAAIGLASIALAILGIKYPFVAVALPGMAVPIVYLTIELRQVSVNNTPNSGPVIRFRSRIISFLAIGFSLIILLGYQNPITNVVLTPLMYMFYGSLVLSYLNVAFEERDVHIDTLHNDRENLFSFMASLGTAIAERKPAEQIVQFVAEAAIENTGADGAAVYMIDEQESVLRGRASAGFYPPPYPVPTLVKTRSNAMREYFYNHTLVIGESILGDCITTVEPIFVQDTATDARLEQNTTDDLMYMSSFIVVPLVVANRVLGVLSTVKRKKDERFEESDFHHLRTFADYASLAIDILFTYVELLEKREIEREINIAADIQKKLVPTRFPALLDGALSVFSLPARGVSGDYYDVFALGKDKVGLFMCDVAGKGVPAALVMVMIQSILHLIASPNRDVVTTLTWVNRGLTGQIEMDHYATMCLLVYDKTERRIEYSNAAHHPMLIYRPKVGRIEQIDTEGLPVGIEKSARYEAKRIRVEPDDLVVLYTDGIVEAMNTEGEQYTMARLVAALKQSCKAPAAEITKQISADITNFVGQAKQHDDQTLMVLRVT